MRGRKDPHDEGHCTGLQPMHLHTRLIFYTQAYGPALSIGMYVAQQPDFKVRV